MATLQGRVLTHHTRKQFNSTVPLVLTAIFVLASFVCLYHLRGGVPRIINGEFCLWNHHFIREISKSEFQSYQKVICLRDTCFAATISSVVLLRIVGQRVEAGSF